MSRWDCIYINDKPVGERQFKAAENHFKSLSKRENIQASEFELLTATAFLLFNQANVRFGIVEVGMGGTLDATNILNNQVVSVITKLAHDHQNFLGNSLHEIALHKAGILRRNVPYIINPANELPVQLDIRDVANEVGAGPHINVHAELEHELTSRADWRDWEKFAFKLPHFQQHNALLAYFAVKQALNGSARLLQSLRALEKVRNPGRCEMHDFPPVFLNTVPDLLVDGAHNEDAAAALGEYVNNYYREQMSTREGRLRPKPRGGWPITWVMAMSEGKDPVKVLQKLLRPGDSIILTTFGPVDGMPWVKPMAPTKILEAARKVVPDITGLVLTKPGVLRALMASRFLAGTHSRIVLTGSLYLVGDFLREKTRSKVTRTQRQRLKKKWQNRINHFLSQQSDELASTVVEDSDEEDPIGKEEDLDIEDADDEDDRVQDLGKSEIKRQMEGIQSEDDVTTDAPRSPSKRSSRKGKDPMEQYFGPSSPTPETPEPAKPSGQ